MNNPPNRRNNRNRATGAIVASVSLLAIVFLAVPWVDEYFDLQRDAVEMNGLEIKLNEARSRQIMLDRVEQKLDSQLEEFVKINTVPDRVELIRETLIEIVRKSGTRLRRLEISMNDKRPWAVENDDARNDTIPLYGVESPFVLHSLVVELQADGSLAGIRTILRNVGNQGWLMTTKNATLTPASTRESPMNLELRLVLFGLAPADPLDQEGDEADPANIATRNDSTTSR